MKKILLLIIISVRAAAQCPNPPTIPGAMVDSASCGLNTGSVHPFSVQNGTAPYHYQWYQGSTLLPGDTNLALNNVGAGIYSISVTDANGCSATGATTFQVPGSPAVVSSFSTNPASGSGSIPLTVSFVNLSSNATSYQWDFGDGTNSSTVNPSHTYTTVGTYSVSLIAASGSCMAISYSTINAYVVDIEVINVRNECTIYPNPADKQLFIELNNDDKMFIELVDATGRSVLRKTTGKSSTMDISTMHEGVYSLIVRTAASVTSRKLIILH